MRKVVTVSLLFLFLTAGPTQAAGLVPCSGGDCTVCHFFGLIDNILDFILIRVVPAVAVVLMFVGGLRLLLSAGDPGKATSAKKMIYSTVIGVFIILVAFLAVDTILSAIGLADWAKEWWNEGFIQINCII